MGKLMVGNDRARRDSVRVKIRAYWESCARVNCSSVKVMRKCNGMGLTHMPIIRTKRSASGTGRRRVSVGKS